MPERPPGTPPPGVPKPVVPDDTTPIELVEPHRLFDEASEGLRCDQCQRYLCWNSAVQCWWCVNLYCRWYRKTPTRP